MRLAQQKTLGSQASIPKHRENACIVEVGSTSTNSRENVCSMACTPGRVCSATANLSSRTVSKNARNSKAHEAKAWLDRAQFSAAAQKIAHHRPPRASGSRDSNKKKQKHRKFARPLAQGVFRSSIKLLLVVVINR